MIKDFITQSSHNLYRNGTLRRIFKESAAASMIPKMYYHFFLKNKPFPSYINIEITNTCNLACDMCPNSQIADDKKGFMNIQLFRKIIKEIDSFGSSNLLFVKQGEPFLHPQVHDFLSFLRQTKNRQNILWVSNGTTLTKKHIDALIEYQIDELNLSIDSLQPETYFGIRGVKLEKALKGIELLQETKIKKKSELPRISVNMVIRKDNVHEIKSARAFFNKHNIQHTVQKYNQDYTGLDVGTARWTLRNDHMPERYPCAHVFVNVVINYDGSVSLCCADWANVYKIGDLHKKSIHEIWNSDEYKFIRECYLNGHYDKISICANCSAWQNNPNVFFPWQYNKILDVGLHNQASRP